MYLKTLRCGCVYFFNLLETSTLSQMYGSLIRLFWMCNSLGFWCDFALGCTEGERPIGKVGSCKHPPLGLLGVWYHASLFTQCTLGYKMASLKRMHHFQNMNFGSTYKNSISLEIRRLETRPGPRVHETLWASSNPCCLLKSQIRAQMYFWIYPVFL